MVRNEANRLSDYLGRILDEYRHKPEFQAMFRRVGEKPKAGGAAKSSAGWMVVC
jgi:hypothetical protein